MSELCTTGVQYSFTFVDDYLEELQQVEKLEASSCFLPPLQEFSLEGTSCVSPSKPSRTAYGPTVKRFPLLWAGIPPPSLYSITYITYHQVNNNYSVTPEFFWEKIKKTLNSHGRHHVPV